jgi:hypothetical protein
MSPWERVGTGEKDQRLTLTPSPAQPCPPPSVVPSKAPHIEGGVTLTATPATQKRKSPIRTTYVTTTSHTHICRMKVYLSLTLGLHGETGTLCQMPFQVQGIQTSTRQTRSLASQRPHTSQSHTAQPPIIVTTPKTYMSPSHMTLPGQSPMSQPHHHNYHHCLRSFHS